jgi:hypothetical protein
MSNYTLAVNWSGKDGLSDSDAAKVISGSDFNSEFTTVRTAVNSKADLNGSASEGFAIDDATVAGTLTVGETLTVTGIPTIPTASAGTNTTQAASTAFVTAAVAALDAAAINAIVYPVGSIYTNMAVATNPATLLGMGTWVAYAEGRVLVGKQSSGTFDTLDESLGAETHTLTIAEMPSHTHVVDSFHHTTNGSSNGGASSGANLNRTAQATGGGGAHNNLQPSVTVYMWKRTA